MGERHELLLAHDVVARIPEKIEVNTLELNAIFQVLRLLSTLIDTVNPSEQGGEARLRTRDPRV
jgi:hypothetical protein